VSGADVPRLAPLPEAQWDDDVRDALRAAFSHEAAERFLSTGPDGIRVPNAVSTMFHHPRLAGPYLAYNGVLLFSGVLEPRLRELVILRVAGRTGSMYEWAQHVRLAEGIGIRAAEIEAAGRGASADADAAWTAVEGAVLAATDQLLDHHGIDDDTWARLAAHLDERQLVELVFVVGTYSLLAMAFNSFGVQLDPDLDPRPMPRPPGTET
jgi:4-carboxymuconolactone decarboxylase